MQKNSKTNQYISGKSNCSFIINSDTNYINFITGLLFIKINLRKSV